jgi:hypothetical protein
MYVWREWDIQYADPDPGRQKGPTEKEECTKFYFMNCCMFFLDGSRVLL